MEKKRILSLVLILAILFTINLIFAASNDTSTTPVDQAFSCLKSQLGDNCGNTQNTQQLAFSMLAIADDSKLQSNCKQSLKDKEQTNCWSDTSSGSCNLKSTAISTLALKTVGENVDDEIGWLLAKRKTATGLTWYLEIDSKNSTQCKINGATFTIKDDKTISGSTPSGLSMSYYNYLFQINDLTKSYEISCNSDFITTLLYQKPGSTTVYVSSETHSASASDSTTEQVNSYCFSNSNLCDYEGTLWTSIALEKAGEDVSSYIPYLIAMSDDSSNKAYLPSAFLYMLNHADDSYLTDLTSRQQQGKYWQESSDKLYDTSVALLALRGSSSDVVSNTKDYLLSIREPSGCWSSNTAFILYAGWMKIPAVGGETGTSNCEDFGYSCTSASECDLSNKLSNFFCPGTNICCKSAPQKSTCSQKQGLICTGTQECTENTVPASDTTGCCLGSCKDISATNDCTDLGYTCKSSCSSTDDEKTNYNSACSPQKCCSPKTSSSGFSGWTYIIILVILIIILGLAIYFRDKLKIWFFKMKSGFKSKPGPAPSSRPPMPPPGYRPLPPPRGRQIIPRQQVPQRTQPRTSSTQRNSEFDETMKKLRDMSK